MTKHDDIIHLKRPVSARHPPMSMEARAAQFSPFAALTGYGDEIDETARLTSERAALNEEEMDRLNRQLARLIQTESEHPLILVRYFVEDERKEGGAYQTYTGRVRKIDTTEKMMHFFGEKKISLNDIREITEML